MKLQLNINPDMFKGTKPGFRLAWLTSTNGIVFGQIVFDDLETAYSKMQDIVCNSKCIILYFDGKGDVKVVL